MLGRSYENQVCSIARSLEIVGERWSLLIVRDALFAGVTRFADFQHNLGIASNVLASRLESFVEAGIMTRDDADYRLTAKGRALAPALVALSEWGDAWASPIEPPIRYVHDACEAPVHVHLECDRHGRIPDDEVAVRLGPGMPPEYAASRRGGVRARHDAP